LRIGDLSRKAVPSADIASELGRLTKLALAFSVGLVAVALPLAQDLVPKWLIFLVPGAVTGALIFGDWDSRFRIAAGSVARPSAPESREPARRAENPLPGLPGYSFRFSMRLPL